MSCLAFKLEEYFGGSPLWQIGICLRASIENDRMILGIGKVRGFAFMNTVEMRQYLAQRINELPPKLLPIVIELVDFLLVKDRVTEIDVLRGDEAEVALKVAPSTIQRPQPVMPESSQPIRRYSTARSLLMFANTWVGDDAEDCLHAVKNSGSDIALELD